MTRWKIMTVEPDDLSDCILYAGFKIQIGGTFAQCYEHVLEHGIDDDTLELPAAGDPAILNVGKMRKEHQAWLDYQAEHGENLP